MITIKWSQGICFDDLKSYLNNGQYTQHILFEQYNTHTHTQYTRYTDQTRMAVASIGWVAISIKWPTGIHFDDLHRCRRSGNYTLAFVRNCTLDTNTHKQQNIEIGRYTVHSGLNAIILIVNQYDSNVKHAIEDSILLWLLAGNHLEVNLFFS